MPPVLTAHDIATAAAPRGPITLAEAPKLIKTIREGLEILLDRGGIDARASRQKGEVQYKVGACSQCRTAKTKCSGDDPCKRCAGQSLACSYLAHARRGRKREPTPNAMLIVSLLRDAEAVYTAITGETVEEKPLDVLRGTRPTVVKPPAPPAPPALNLSSLPVYSPPVASTSKAIPPPPPTRVSPPDLLVSVSEALDEQNDGSDGSSQGDEVDDADEEMAKLSVAETSADTNLGGLITNPLAILAHVATGPRKRGETTEQESGVGGGFVPSVYDSLATAESYFSTGLYEIRLDVATDLDIVNLGFISAPDFASVVEFYFVHLRPSTFHLDRRIHSPSLLRETSPFLSTVLAYIVAGFVPALVHLLPALYSHALFLSNRVFSCGFKSLECVQAYALLAEWAEAGVNWGSDKQWTWIGQALRIASELRMDKETNSATALRYASTTSIPEGAVALFSEDRRRSCSLLFMTEISASVATGRFEAISALNLFGGIQAADYPVQRGDEALAALAALHRIYAKSLMLAAGLREELSPGSDSADFQTAFNASWEQEIKTWKKKWPSTTAQVQIAYYHIQTILLSLSLQFPGPVLPILERCRTTALETVKVIAHKPDSSLVYGPSALVVAMAYAATLLLRLESLSTTSDSKSDYRALRPLCTATAATLEGMAARRPAVRTAASLHSSRLRKLLEDFDNVHTPAGVPVHTPPALNELNPTVAQTLDDSSLLALLAPFDNNLYGSPAAGADLDVDSWMASSASGGPPITADAPFPAAWWEMPETTAGTAQGGENVDLFSLPPSI